MMFSRPPKHFLPFIVFIVTIAIDLSFLFLVPDSLKQEEFTDYRAFYEPVARNIANGRGITVNGDVATFQGPGLPVILAALFVVAEYTFFSEELLLTLGILICSGLTTTLVYLIADQIWSGSLAILVSLAWTIYPLNLWFLQHFSSELPFMVMLYLGLFLLWKMRRGHLTLVYGLLCGGVLGLSALIRPIGIGLPFLACISLWFFTRHLDNLPLKLKLTLSPLFGGFLVILPWITWASYQSGELVLIASSGVGTVVDGLTYAVDDDFPDDTVSPEVAALQTRILEDKPQSMGELLSLLGKEIANEPGVATELFLVKFSRNWYGTYSGQREMLSLLLHLPFFGLGALGSIGSWFRKEVRKYIVVNWIFFGYFLSMSTAVNTNVRYIAPAMGIILIFSPGILDLVKRLLFRQLQPQSAVV